MIVADASVVVHYLLSAGANAALEQLIGQQSALAAPVLIDFEVVNTLRRLLLLKVVNGTQAQRALDDLEKLRLDRYPADLLRRRMWQLRNSISAYDASYVALSEMLSFPLYTRDKRLAHASGHTANIILI